MARGLRLRCPRCGVSPLFKPLREVRSLVDWFSTLDGCPRCNYRYEREPGYFLLSIFAINYSLMIGTGLGLWIVTELFFGLPLRWQLVVILAPMMVVGLLAARHSKAVFLAFDLWLVPVR